jgi:hypothetical protein
MSRTVALSCLTVRSRLAFPPIRSNPLIRKGYTAPYRVPPKGGRVVGLHTPAPCSTRKFFGNCPQLSHDLLHAPATTYAYGGGGCWQLRQACLHKEELGEEGMGNCRRYRELCR